MKEEILSALPENHPWRNTIHCFDSLPSTNDLAKTMAAQGAPEGTVLVAAQQTAGRGRMGRSFYAPAGLGLYLSVILRPDCTAEQLLHLTCGAAVAVCDGIDQCVGIRPKIKWTNDLVIGCKKLGGILTELSVNTKTGKVEWAVIGIGINCCHNTQDFPPQLQSMATSLLLETKNKCSPAKLAAYITCSLHTLSIDLLTQKRRIMDNYRNDCMTVNSQVMLLHADRKYYGTALDIDNDGGLVVQFDDGQIHTVQTGEISVRGLYGYV